MNVLTREQSREMDSLAMERDGVPGIFLMENAGKAVAEEVKSSFIEHSFVDPVCIVCGKGNNGGDGFAAAIFLHNWGIPVKIYSIPHKNKILGDSAHFHSGCVEAGIPIDYGGLPPDSITVSVIVDAILGTGFSGELREPYSLWTQWINESSKPVFAADIPTGVDCDTGQVSTNSLTAMKTITMGYSKVGLHMEPGKSHAGEIIPADIGFPDLYNELPGYKYSILEDSNVKAYLESPPKTAYKYSMGRTLIIAGSRGMTGAAILSAKAAIRSGSGLVKLCIPESLNATVESLVIEGLTVPCPDDGTGHFTTSSIRAIQEAIEWCDAALVGPGIGLHDETLSSIESVLQNMQKPLVVDADALQLFQKNLSNTDMHDSCILTPHFGEFSRLISKPTDEIKSNIHDIIPAFMETFQGVLHLKNAPSMTIFDNQVVLNSTGNQGLASGGTGDVLSGIMVSLLGQGISAPVAAYTGAYLHGKCADVLVKEKGFRGMIASDLIERLPEVISQYES